MPDFLLEIGCDEIPDRMLDGAREELLRRLHDLLVREGLLGNDRPKGEGFSTPRRIAVRFTGIAQKQEDAEEELIGPPVRVAFKDGRPGPAAEAFAKKAEVPVEQLRRISNPKGEYLAATIFQPGRFTREILGELLPKEIEALYWPKSMYWRGRQRERFVRPVRWIAALLDDTILPLQFAGIEAGNLSRGHRILSDGTVAVSVGAYESRLESNHVIVSGVEREHRIRKALDHATREIPGARWREDPSLLKIAVNLTEFPAVILGSFDREYLSLPEEILVTVMRDHQKYFAIEDAGGRLAPHFLAVLNTAGDPEGIIRHGNERVLRARFNDARFFWNADQKISLAGRVELLAAVTFQKDLGSYYEKTERLVRLAVLLGGQVPGSSAESVKQAAHLAKTDLTTDLVKEFTELQGIVGGLYARAQGLPGAVADAIYDHYRPEGADDPVPRTTEGSLLSIADKADSIAGMFALGLQPSGSKDPFALRRQANGVIRILAEHGLQLGLRTIVGQALAGYYETPDAGRRSRFREAGRVEHEISDFFRERVEFYLREGLGIVYDEVNAVLAAGFDNVPDIVARARAVASVRKSSDFEPIAVAFKRMKNILRQANESGKAVAPSLQLEELNEVQEKILAESAQKARAKVEELCSRRQYSEALAAIASLRPQVDAFFDRVMVMVDDERLRANRLALLQAIVRDFSTIADFSEIVQSA